MFNRRKNKKEKEKIKEKENDEAFAKLAAMKEESKNIEVDKNTGDAEEAKDIAAESEGQLTVDVYQDGKNIMVESTVAGVDPENLEINITNESVTIRGTREREKKIEDKDFFYQECFWGTFSRSVILPHEVDPEKSTAAISKNGLLVIKMPRLDRKKAKKLQVKVD